MGVITFMEFPIPEIIERYVGDKWSLRKIERSFNINRRRLYSIFKENEVPIREGKEFSVETENKIVSDYLQYIPIHKICSNFNTSPGMIVKTLKKHKVQLRNKYETRVNNTSTILKVRTRGVCGYYKDWFFRSLNELSFCISELERKNITWKSGENKEYRIPYLNPKSNRINNYYPDFITPNAVIEIKARYLFNDPLVLAKETAAENWVKDKGLVYEIIDYPINLEDIRIEFLSGNIQFITTTGPTIKKIMKELLS